jgi:hypothetical protein
MVSKGEGKFDHKHKTEMKYAVGDEHEGKFTVTNKDWNCEWEYAPAQFNTGNGHEVTFQTELKSGGNNGTFEGKVENKCGGYEMGPLRGWSEL